MIDKLIESILNNFGMFLIVWFSVPILYYVIPILISLNNIVATFVALALGIWVSGYVIYAIAMLIGAIAIKMEESSKHNELDR